MYAGKLIHKQKGPQLSELFISSLIEFLFLPWGQTCTLLSTFNLLEAGAWNPGNQAYLRYMQSNSSCGLSQILMVLF